VSAVQTKDIGIIGMGLWEGEPVTNDHFGVEVGGAQVKDPYKGRRSDDGAVRVAGLELTPDRHPRTLAALAHAFEDPYRGTRRRRYFPRDLKVSDAETEAAQAALRDAGLAPSDVDAVLVQSFLPDELHPKNAALVCHKLGIERAFAWEVDTICNSSITQLISGSSLIMSGMARHVLCLQSVAYSRVTDPSASSTVQEGDMASAFVLGPSPGTRMSFGWRTQGRLHAAIKLAWGPRPSPRPRQWWEGASEGLFIGFDPALQAELMSQIAENAPVVCQEALGRAEMRVEDVDVFITHQATYWQSSFMEDVIGVRPGVGFETFEEYANINSAGIPTSVAHARRQGKIARGRKVLLFGPAAGYTYAAAAIHW
jgi:3-oxoacyl-[acyl-carrier-protein] synthase III